MKGGRQARGRSQATPDDVVALDQQVLGEVMGNAARMAAPDLLVEKAPEAARDREVMNSSPSGLG